MNAIPRELEYAWPHLLAGDVAAVIEQLRYVDQPCRIVREIAESLRQQHPGTELAWLQTPNIKLGGKSPAEVLVISDDGTWKDVALALIPNNARVIPPSYVQQP